MVVIKKIKVVYLTIILILLVLLIYLVKFKKQYIINSADNFIEKNRIDEFISNLKENYVDCESENKLISIQELASKINDEKILNNINKYNINGCFEIKDGTITYYESSCNDVKVDINISNNPIVLPNSIPVVYENDNYIKKNFIDWYNYKNHKFAYTVIGNFENKQYLDNEIIDKSLITNVFVWIPAFYYNEEKSQFSYATLGGVSKYKHYSYTNYDFVPFAFFYKNRYSYGFWLQIDNNALHSGIKNKSNVDVHLINKYDKKAIEWFQRYYNIDNLYSGDKKYIITIGKGAFFNSNNS